MSSFPVREPMLAAGQVDAITGYSFTSYVDLKDKGVPVDDIVVLLMADYGVELYGNAILVNYKIRRRASRCRAEVSCGLHERPEGHREAALRPQSSSVFGATRQPGKTSSSNA